MQPQDEALPEADAVQSRPSSNEVSPNSCAAQGAACCSGAKWWWLGVLIVAGAGFVAFSYLRHDGSLSRAESHVGVGRQAPSMRFAPLLGTSQEVSTSTLRGSVVVINFWGTWCPPCRREFPHLVALGKELAGEPRFRLVAVSCGSDVESELREETASFLREAGAELAIYWDPDHKARTAVEHTIGFEGYPTTLVLDAQGVIRGVFVGYTPGDEAALESLVRKLLAEAA